MFYVVAFCRVQRIALLGKGVGLSSSLLQGCMFRVLMFRLIKGWEGVFWLTLLGVSLGFTISVSGLQVGLILEMVRSKFNKVLGSFGEWGITS